jgi:uncharacterized membrane protein
MELTATTTIGKPASDVYAFWRELENKQDNREKIVVEP